MRYFVYCLVVYVVVKFILPMLLAIAVFSALMVFVIPLAIREFISSFKRDHKTTQEEEDDEQAAQDQADVDEYYAQYDEDKRNRHY